MQWQIEKIINVSHELRRTGKTGASTSEQIAAAFVLDNMDYLPAGYSAVEAWERLDNWQAYVKCIRQEYMHLIKKA